MAALRSVTPAERDRFVSLAFDGFIVPVLSQLPDTGLADSEGSANAKVWLEDEGWKWSLSTRQGMESINIYFKRNDRVFVSRV